MTIAVALVIAGLLGALGGFGYAAYRVWLDLRRDRFGVLAGEARWGIRVMALGGLLSAIGILLGGCQDVVKMLGG